MIKKTEVEMERARIAKIIRAKVRLKYSLEADKELNDILPDTLAEFDLALQHGELKAISAGLDDVLES